MKFLPYIMLITFLALLVTSVIYLSRRFAWFSGVDHTWPFYIGFSLLPVFFIAAGIVFTNATGTAEHIVYKIASVTMGVYLFLLMSVLVVHLTNMFLKLSPAMFGMVSLGLTLLISVYGYWNSTNIRNTKLEIPVDGLTQEIKAVHLSDIHIGHFRTNGFLQDIVDKTNAAKPDVVFMTGDYLDSKYALQSKYFNPLKKLMAPVYSVDGNHDYATHNDSITTLMRQAGVQVLQNDVKSIKGLQIVGLNHMTADRSSFDVHASGHKPTIQEVLPKLNIDQDKPSVLLHHAPNGIQYAEKAGIDLYLAGHTHAGQIFPFNLFAKLLFDFNRGLHSFKNTKIFVSEGIGTFGPPFRIGTRSEIVEIRLVPN